MKKKIVGIVGKSGILVNQIAIGLLNAGYFVRIITQNTQENNILKYQASLGKLYFEELDITDDDELRRVISGCSMIIYTSDIFSPRSYKMHYQQDRELSMKIANLCNILNIDRLIYFSILGVNYDSSLFCKIKYKLEGRIKSIFENTDIIRTSIIFGRNDNFLSVIKRMNIYSLKQKLHNLYISPIYVNDIAKVITLILRMNKQGQVYNLYGNESYTIYDLWALMHQKNNNRSHSIFKKILAKIMYFTCKKDMIDIMTLANANHLYLKNFTYDSINIGHFNVELQSIKDYILKTSISE